MDECLQVLSRQPDCAGDKVLVTIVKTQLLADQMNRASWQFRDGTAPPFYISALRSQLQSIKSETPPEVETYGQ